MHYHFKRKKTERYPKAYMSPIGINHLHLRNPLIIAWWSFNFPGFGHLILGKYLSGYLLIIWEMFINIKGRINLCIVYSFTGKFELARSSLDSNWALAYAGVFIFAIWDSYRCTVELNRLSLLSESGKYCLVPFKASSFEICYLNKRNPIVAIFFSIFAPGTGQIYVNRIPLGFILLIWSILILYFSKLTAAIQLSFTGQFREAVNVVDISWLLFFPSVLGFSIYNSYSAAVEYNKLFEYEQATFLMENYQSSEFDMPL